MNLMKYFNYNYMKENIKKSKAILAFFLGIIPVISILFFLGIKDDYNSLTLASISLINNLALEIVNK